ncbi:uncharacterized protein LOC129740012 [Uranotaenia lowii]|uniref:uncharacterized protein LOC129740012 n=1 Tax=Uranotaenia lowii TaxID=190385 RepID=UPI002479BAA0|nr:uncharacterized protein LOC129740012 [Uranotaenia lowii]
MFPAPPVPTVRWIDWRRRQFRLCEVAVSRMSPAPPVPTVRWIDWRRRQFPLCKVAASRMSPAPPVPTGRGSVVHNSTNKVISTITKLFTVFLQCEVFFFISNKFYFCDVNKML